MTRRVAEKLCTKKVCVDFLAPSVDDPQDGWFTFTAMERPWILKHGSLYWCFELRMTREASPSRCVNQLWSSQSVFLSLLGSAVSIVSTVAMSNCNACYAQMSNLMPSNCNTPIYKKLWNVKLSSIVPHNSPLSLQACWKISLQPHESIRTFGHDKREEICRFWALLLAFLCSTGSQTDLV